MQNNSLLVILLVVLLCAAFALTFLGVRAATTWLPQEVSDILVYEVDPHFCPNPTESQMSDLISAINERLNPGFRRQANVERQGTTIKISVLGGDANKSLRIQQLLDSPGTLEVRVLANRQDHSEIVTRATHARSPNEVRSDDEDDALLARWVPTYPECLSNQDQYGCLPAVTRTREQGKRTTTDTLVVHDDANIDETCISNADGGHDNGGTPCIWLTYTANGRKRLTKLIDENLPANPWGESCAQLGIIVNGELRSTQALQQGSGAGMAIRNVSSEEAVDLAASLKAGSLPQRIRFVRKEAPPQER